MESFSSSFDMVSQPPEKKKLRITDDLDEIAEETIDRAMCEIFCSDQNKILYNTQMSSELKDLCATDSNLFPGECYLNSPQTKINNNYQVNQSDSFPDICDYGANLFPDDPENNNEPAESIIQSLDTPANMALEHVGYGLNITEKNDSISDIRNEIINSVLACENQFQVLENKYKDLSHSQLIAEPSIEPINITDQALRSLLSRFKFIKIAGINISGEWKAVFSKKTCKILLRTKNAPEFVKAFEEISKFIRYVGEKFCKIGVKMMLSIDPLDSGIYVSPRKPDQFSGELLLNKFMTVAQSNTEFFASKYLSIDLDGVLSINGGVKSSRPSFKKASLAVDEITNQKSSIRQSKYFMFDTEKNCFFISVAMSLLFRNGINTPERYKQIPKKNKHMEKYSNLLRSHMSNITKLAGINLDHFTYNQLPGVEQFDKVQQVLLNYTFTSVGRVTTRCYQLVIYNTQGHPLYTGSVDCEYSEKVSLNLMFDNQHYDHIVSLTGAFCKSYFCEHCFKGYSERQVHKNCLYSCSACFVSPPCSHRGISDRQYIPCDACGRSFYDHKCFNKHLENKICMSVRYCKICGNFKTKSHKCGMFFCKTCAKEVNLEHTCNIAVYKPEKFAVKNHFYVFFDLETMTEKTDRKGLTFVPVLCVSQIVCDECISIDASQFNCRFCGERQKVFKNDNNDDVMGKFLRYIFKKSECARVTAIAHNSSNFDGLFVLKKIFDSKRSIDPFIVAQGTKLFLIKVGHIRFIDSLNFFPCALAKLPTLMGFDDTSKGYFPHKFNVQEHQNYIGSYPESKFYGPDEMKAEVKKKFEAWYETVKDLIFDFQWEMLQYCIMDVEILRKACIKFTLEMEAEAGFPIFQHTITLASAVNKIFRKSFYKPDSIAITPISYRMQDKQSNIALKYILYLEMKLKVKIQSSLDGSEKLIVCPPNKRYKVDGYFKSADGIETVVEFNGCYYHNHQCHLPNSKVHLRQSTNMPSIDNSSNNPSFENLDENGALRRERTARKLKDLQESGYKVITMYECEFKKILQNDAQLAIKLNDNFHNDPLCIRDSFFGGNVDTTCTQYKVKGNEKIKYVDFTSLYPTVNMYDEMPTGSPTRIILGHEKCSEINMMTFNGFLKVRVIPPKNIFFGVLPAKINGKLVFTLCFTCAKMGNPDKCEHTDLQRSFIGTFVSTEFKLALEKGYKIEEIFEVQEFELRNDLFADYIKHNYVKKLYASGAPSGIDLDEYIEQYKQHEGIQLDRTMFQNNPAKRTLAKLMLNTLWGKFGETEKNQSEIIQDPQRLLRLVANDQINIKGMQIINDNFIWVTYELHDPKPLKTSSVALASFVTACARVRLYRLLDKLGQDALYKDTDAAIYVSTQDDDPRAKTGHFLGDLTDELSGYGEGSYITEFTSGGPKNYAARGICPATGKTFEICKVKGITLNFKNQKLVNYDTVFKQANNPRADRVLVKDYCFIRDKDATVRIDERLKEYRSVLTKRRRVGNRTYPYGYDENLILLD